MSRGGGLITNAAAPDVSAFTNRLAKNLAHWLKWARRRAIGCFRLYDRDVPQFPLVIDWYETVAPRAEVHEVHLHVQEIDTDWQLDDAQYDAWLIAVCDAIVAVCAVPPACLHLKRRERQRGTSQYEKLETSADRFVALEGTHRFEVNFDAYLDTGLFLDHRQTRALVAESVARRAAAGNAPSFLNLFAYTGSFTVYAARAGAASSLTIDLSNTYQAWTRRNLALNTIDPAHHVLERADAMTWLVPPRAERFDVIVLDPPSFSNSKKMQGVLDVQRDHVWLIRQCHGLLAAGGELLFATNLRSFEIERAAAERFGLHEITGRTLPEDFRRSSPHRAWHCTKTAQ